MQKFALHLHPFNVQEITKYIDQLKNKSNYATFDNIMNKLLKGTTNKMSQRISRITNKII